MKVPEAHPKNSSRDFRLTFTPSIYRLSCNRNRWRTFVLFEKGRIWNVSHFLLDSSNFREYHSTLSENKSKEKGNQKEPSRAFNDKKCQKKNKTILPSKMNWKNTDHYQVQEWEKRPRKKAIKPCVQLPPSLTIQPLEIILPLLHVEFQICH